MESIRVVIADDHPLLRQGMQTVLRQSGTIEVVGEVETGREALQLVETLQPDVLILDAELPDMAGMDVADELYTRGTATGVLVLSAYDDLEYVRRFVAAGVAGYLLKEEASWQIVGAVEATARGETGQFSHRIRTQLNRLERGGETNLLTPREIDVLRELAEGKTNYAIGQALKISEKTVEKHLGSIYRKLDVGSRTEAAVLAVRDEYI